MSIPATINKMPVTEIGDYAFGSSLLGLSLTDSPPIKEVVLPATIRKIGTHALSGRAVGTSASFTLPRDLEVIGDYAFAYNFINNNGKELKLPAKLKSIGIGAFRWNDLQSVSIPSSVKTMGKYAFEHNDLKHVAMGSGITTIPTGAFRYNRIVSLTLPKNLVAIDSEAFFANRLPRLILPNSVQTIGDFAFSRNELSAVTLTNKVTTIGDGAFVQNKLTAFDVPSKMKEFPINALLLNPLQKLNITGSSTKLANYSPIFEWNAISYNLANETYALYTDKQLKKAWTGWNQTITRPTTLYVKQAQ